LTPNSDPRNHESSQTFSLSDIEMKDGIHPKYQDCVVTCGCGNTFNTRSTKAKIAVEVCSKCHPYFTGSVKFVDAAGRVDRFNKKFQGTYGKGKKGAAAAAGEKT
jgi:large subunit ribosomal protein L31